MAISGTSAIQEVRSRTHVTISQTNAWGGRGDYPFLHFEACYYQGIEFAIAERLERFEGGAQGEHKMFRGMMPAQSLSAHWLRHPRFARAIEEHLERESEGVARYVDELKEHSPYRGKD